MDLGRLDASVAVRQVAHGSHHGNAVLTGRDFPALATGSALAIAILLVRFALAITGGSTR